MAAPANVRLVVSAASKDAALTTSLTFAGPANYCPVLVGSIGGARWGAGGIRAEHLAHCRDLTRVEKAGNVLAPGWGAKRR